MTIHHRTVTPLRQRMIDEMTIRNFSKGTQEQYLCAVSLFARHFSKSPERLGPKEIKAYQLYLIHEKKQAPSTINRTVCALRFLYQVVLGKRWAIEHIVYAKTDKPLPVVLGEGEAWKFLNSISNIMHLAMLLTAYSAGLRLTEVVSLRVSDIDSQRKLIRVRHGKGRKDRYVMLSPTLLTVLREYWKAVRPTSWLFPGRTHDRPLSATSLAAICRRYWRESGLKKKVNLRMLRHTFATHLLEDHRDIRAIQAVLGHRSIQTTSIYTRVSERMITSMPSPLERLVKLAMDSSQPESFPPDSPSLD